MHSSFSIDFVVVRPISRRTEERMKQEGEFRNEISTSAYLQRNPRQVRKMPLENGADVMMEEQEMQLVKGREQARPARQRRARWRTFT